jgi:Rrf2 family iron-sulfur cluster assembly transcriptional regulator
VTGLRGPGGGYCLRRPASEISVADILRAVDESLEAVAHPVSTEAAQAEQRGESLLLWDQLSHQIYAYLDSISLAQAVTTKDGAKLVAGALQRSAA